MISFAAPQTDPASDHVDDRARTILIVDDDADQAQCLAHRLERQGFLTTVAHRGLLALSVAQTDRPDLVLLDLHLPDLDGLEVCRDLSDSPLTSDIPVIMVSGTDRPDIVRRARCSGCVYFLRKPYDPNALLGLVQLALRDRWPF